MAVWLPEARAIYSRPSQYRRSWDWLNTGTGGIPKTPVLGVTLTYNLENRYLGLENGGGERRGGIGDLGRLQFPS